jgi:PAS domain S-box-containing protein
MNQKRHEVARSEVEPIGAVIDHLARVALVARALTASLRPSEVIEIVVRQGMAGLGAEGGVLALIAADGVVVPVETVGYTKEAVAAFTPMNVGQQLPLTVAARDREAVWVSSRADAASRFPALLEAAVSGSQAWVAIPLIADGSAIGVLGVSFLAPRDFSEPERLFIRALGDQCALALAAVYRTQRVSQSPTVDDSAPSARSRRRAERRLEFPIHTLVVRRDGASEIGRAIREDPRYLVSECDDHEVLVDLMQKERIDLVVVLSDLQAASRMQIANTVRAQRPEAALVLLTGDPEVEEQAWRIGADAVFGMAMPPGLLRAALVALLDGTSPGPSPTAQAGFDNVPTGTARSRSPRAAAIDAPTLWSATFARSLDAVMFAAADGRVLAANAAACRVLGLSEEEIRERGRSGLADPCDARWVSGLRERESTGRFFGELSMLRGDGMAFGAELSSATFENELGEQRTVVVFRDLDDRKRLAAEGQSAAPEEELRDRMAQALLEVAIRRLWAVGTSLQGGLQGPSGLLIARVQEAIDELDDTIRVLRETLFSDDRS